MLQSFPFNSRLELYFLLDNINCTRIKKTMPGKALCKTTRCYIKVTTANKTVVILGSTNVHLCLYFYFKPFTRSFLDQSISFGSHGIKDLILFLKNNLPLLNINNIGAWTYYFGNIRGSSD